MNRGAWQTTVHGVAKSWTNLSDSRRREEAHGGFNLHLLMNNGVDIHWIIKKAREFQKNIYFCFIDYAKAFDFVDHNKLWKILKEMGIPDYLTCLLRNLYAGQEATVSNWTWNRLVPNRTSNMSRLYIVTLLI